MEEINRSLRWPATVSVDLPAAESLTFLPGTFTIIRQELLSTYHPIMRTERGSNTISFLLTVPAAERSAAQDIVASLASQIMERFCAISSVASVEEEPFSVEPQVEARLLHLVDIPRPEDSQK